jgi:hypothetical protein
MKSFTSILMALLLWLPALTAAQQTPLTQPAVSREEYEKLLREQQEMRREIEKLKAERAAPATQEAPSSKAGSASPAMEPARVEDIDDLSAQLKKVGDTAHAGLPGSERLVIAGDASIGFTSQNKSNSNFSAEFSPLFLFAPTDRLLFEAALDVGIGTDMTDTSSTSVDLTIADASIILNDNLIVGGGLFVVPFGQYHNHFDPPWINKLPDDPIIFSNNTAPGSEVGFFAKGVNPATWLRSMLPSATFTYDLYLANGPGLITSNNSGAGPAGQLNFADYTDLNNGKAVGGRLALLPYPNLEFGYSIQYSQTSPGGFPHVHALLQAADLNWVQECRPLGGVFTTRCEWVWSQLESGSNGFRSIDLAQWVQGGYCTIAYRPTLSTSKWLRDTEFVFRYDMQRAPLNSNGGDHESRYTLGIDYWLSPAWVLKAAYEFDNRKTGVEQSAFYLQLGLGL